MQDLERRSRPPTCWSTALLTVEAILCLSSTTALFTIIYLDCGVCLLNICSLSVGVIVHNGRVITDKHAILFILSTVSNIDIINHVHKIKWLDVPI